MLWMRLKISWIIFYWVNRWRTFCTTTKEILARINHRMGFGGGTRTSIQKHVAIVVLRSRSEQTNSSRLSRSNCSHVCKCSNQSIAHRCVKAMLEERSHRRNRSLVGNNNHLAKLRRSVDSKASILNPQVRELSDDDPKRTPVAGSQQRRTHAQQQHKRNIQRRSSIISSILTYFTILVSIFKKTIYPTV